MEKVMMQEKVASKRISTVAVLIRSIEFENIEGELVSVEAGRKLGLDLGEMIASYDGLNFDVAAGEIRVIDSEDKEVEAVLSQDIEFENIDGNTIVVASGGAIVMDLENNIARYGNDYFDIQDCEYIVVQ